MAVQIFQRFNPANSDNLCRTLIKVTQTLYNALMPLTPPFPGGFTKLSPTRGDTAQSCARKLNALVFIATTGVPSLPSPNIPFARLDPHGSDTLSISLAKINALQYIQAGGTP